MGEGEKGIDERIGDLQQHVSIHWSRMDYLENRIETLEHEAITADQKLDILNESYQELEYKYHELTEYEPDEEEDGEPVDDSDEDYPDDRYEDVGDQVQSPSLNERLDLYDHSVTYTLERIGALDFQMTELDKKSDLVAEHLSQVYDEIDRIVKTQTDISNNLAILTERVNALVQALKPTL